MADVDIVGGSLFLKAGSLLLTADGSLLLTFMILQVPQQCCRMSIEMYLQ